VPEGRWRRTISPWREGAGYIAEGELRGDRQGSLKIWRGTDGSNPFPSSSESGANLQTPLAVATSRASVVEIAARCPAEGTDALVEIPWLRKATILTFLVCFGKN
jgi:hypothetical protein